MDSALNNLQGLICHKPKLTSKQIHTSLIAIQKITFNYSSIFLIV